MAQFLTREGEEGSAGGKFERSGTLPFKRQLDIFRVAILSLSLSLSGIADGGTLAAWEGVLINPCANIYLFTEVRRRGKVGITRPATKVT